MIGSGDRREQQLDELFRSYKEACGQPEASANFMPRLWERIEGSQQQWTFQAWRWARGLTMAAAVASLFMVMLQMVPHKQSIVYTATYLETLADAHDDDEALYAVSPSVKPAEARQSQESPVR